MDIQRDTNESPPSPPSITGLSSFESLPSELRNYIYELSGGLCDDPICLHGPEKVVQPAITRVSKLIREETLPIFYGNHHFVLRLLSQTGPEKSRILLWLDAIGHRNASRLRSVHIVNARKQDRKTIENDFLRDMRVRGVFTSRVKIARIAAPFKHTEASVLEAGARARGM
ncbi:hypothetical protein Slin14017_G074280 [Septoria linicola]|nr:hypothetical protein Slin14017_G074280 [Septoria linicola]